MDKDTQKREIQSMLDYLRALYTRRGQATALYEWHRYLTVNKIKLHPEVIEDLKKEHFMFVEYFNGFS